MRAVHAELLARTPENDVQLRLDPVREVLSLLGDPHLAYPVVHVAGTNGKTSTARFTERILREMNLRTGLLTSPHLVSVTERVAVDGQPLDDEAFVAAHEDVAPYLEMVDGRLRAGGQAPLTYFEALTVIALAAFADAPVDVAVVEVGLGGEWDATNVVTPAVTVITPISLDHTDLLGDDVAQIAVAKAGIVKPGAVTVLAAQGDEATDVVLRAAVRAGSPVVREGVDFGVSSRTVAVGGSLVTIEGVGARFADVVLSAHGAHQASNAALAVAAVEVFLGAAAAPGGGQASLEPDVVRAALADVTTPGRLEVVRRSPLVLLDAAHNVAGAQALVAALDEEFALRPAVGVLAVLRGKDALGILEVLEPVLATVVVTASTSPRAMDVGALAELAGEVFGEERVLRAASLPDALQVAVDAAESHPDADAGGGPGPGVVVTGSVTVVGEARLLLGGPR